MNTTLDSKDKSGKIFGLAMILMVVLGIGAVLFFASDREVIAQAAETIEIDGEPLSLLEAGEDVEVGSTFPTIRSVDFDGNPISIEPDGNPKVLYFLAHWCVNCQEEVPAVQALIDEGQVPEGLEIISIATQTYDAENQVGQPGNYPVSAWLEGEDWTPPVLLDTFASEAFTAAGGTGTPFVVALDGNNTVLARVGGRLADADTVSLWNSTAAAVGSTVTGQDVTPIESDDDQEEDDQEETDTDEDAEAESEESDESATEDVPEAE